MAFPLTYLNLINTDTIYLREPFQNQLLNNIKRYVPLTCMNVKMAKPFLLLIFKICSVSEKNPILEQFCLKKKISLKELCTTELTGSVEILLVL